MKYLRFCADCCRKGAQETGFQNFISYFCSVGLQELVSDDFIFGPFTNNLGENKGYNNEVCFCKAPAKVSEPEVSEREKKGKKRKEGKEGKEGHCTKGYVSTSTKHACICGWRCGQMDKLKKHYEKYPTFRSSNANLSSWLVPKNSDPAAEDEPSAAAAPGSTDPPTANNEINNKRQREDFDDVLASSCLDDRAGTDIKQDRPPAPSMPIVGTRRNEPEKTCPRCGKTYKRQGPHDKKCAPR